MSLGRNPYVILGVDHGAPAHEVTRAFARRSRLLRRRNDPPYTLADLTWALGVLEGLGTNGTADHIFRVPADPGLFDLTDGAGLFAPAPATIPRVTESLSDEHFDRAAHHALQGVARNFLHTFAHETDGRDPYWTGAHDVQPPANA